MCYSEIVNIRFRTPPPRGCIYPTHHSITLSSITPESPPLAPRAPEPQRSACCWPPRRLGGWLLPIRSPITLDRDTSTIAPEPSLHKPRGLNNVAATAEGGIEPREEIVGVCGQKPRTLIQGGGGAAHEKIKSEHGPGKPDYVEGDEVEGNAFAAVVLRVGVCKSENECCHQRRVSRGIGSSLVEASFLEVSPGMKVMAWRKPPAVTCGICQRQKCVFVHPVSGGRA